MRISEIQSKPIKEKNKRKHREKVADPTWADPWTSSGTHKIHGHPGAKEPDWFAKKDKGGFLQKGFDVKERSLTKAEKKKMKHYDKKLSKSEFKDRYGKEGESIYYATATKMAKKNA